jgi:hypothetical protein
MAQENKIERKFDVKILHYNNSADPTNFIDVREYAGYEVLIPAAANGRTINVLSADDSIGTNAAIPYRHNPNTDTYVVFAALPSVVTGRPYDLQADGFAIHWLGLRMDSAITGDISVRLKA